MNKLYGTEIQTNRFAIGLLGMGSYFQPSSNQQTCKNDMNLGGLNNLIQEQINELDEKCEEPFNNLQGQHQRHSQNIPRCPVDQPTCPELEPPFWRNEQARTNGKFLSSSSLLQANLFSRRMNFAIFANMKKIAKNYSKHAICSFALR